jgi:hypothetical protein
MPTYDFSKQLSHRTGSHFTTVTVGLGAVEGLWNDPQQYNKPIAIGTVLELLLLYTVDRKAQQRPPPHNVLSEEDKRRRFALAYKIRDCKKTEIEHDEVELLRTAISVLAVEPNGLCHTFLDNPEA